VSLSVWGISTCRIRPSITNQFTGAVSTHTDPQGTAIDSGLLLHVAYVTKLRPKLHSHPHVASFPKLYCFFFPNLSGSVLLVSWCRVCSNLQNNNYKGCRLILIPINTSSLSQPYALHGYPLCSALLEINSVIQFLNLPPL